MTAAERLDAWKAEQLAKAAPLTQAQQDALRRILHPARRRSA